MRGSRTFNNLGFVGCAVPVLVVILIPVLIGLGIAGNFNRQTRVCTVDSKEAVLVGSGEDTSREYRIYCTDGLVVKNVDEWIIPSRLKMNSAELQARAGVGQTYEFRTTGWRIPFLSTFPNVYEISPTETE